MNIREATLWTDATVDLSWISGSPSRWKKFVCKRVTEIQTYTTPTQWKHCHADYLSRGVNADQLKVWTRGGEGRLGFRMASNHGHVTR